MNRCETKAKTIFMWIEQGAENLNAQMGKKMKLCN